MVIEAVHVDAQGQLCLDPAPAYALACVSLLFGACAAICAYLLVGEARRQRVLGLDLSARLVGCGLARS